MPKVSITVLLFALVAACSRAHPTTELAPTCSIADRALLDDLQRTIRDSARIAPLERALADTATMNALSRALADAPRRTDLRRSAADSAWSAQHQPQIDALRAELARFDSCTR